MTKYLTGIYVAYAFFSIIIFCAGIRHGLQDCERGYPKPTRMEPVQISPDEDLQRTSLTTFSDLPLKPLDARASKVLEETTKGERTGRNLIT